MRVALTTVTIASIVATSVLLLTCSSDDRTPPLTATDPFLCTQAKKWRTAHGTGDDLHIIAVDVTFRGTAKNFQSGNAIVVAPIAAVAPGVQDLVAVETSPPAVKQLRADGAAVVTWAYAGGMHNDLRYRAIALVRRATATSVDRPETPTFGKLAKEERLDATMKASDSDEHKLQRCKAFPEWVKEAAGDPPYTEQHRRILQKLAAKPAPTDDKRERRHDLCAAIREGVFTYHERHVLAVMALRELGAPAYGLVGADSELIVATYVDEEGWIELYLNDHELEYRSGGAPLLARVPAASPFEAAQDGFWDPTAGAYTESMGRLRTLSSTEWFADRPTDTARDATTTFTVPLAKACP